MRKLILMILAAVLAFSAVAAPKTYELASPDGTLKAEVVLNGTDITYSVLKDGKAGLAPSRIAMQLADGTAYDGAVKLRKAERTSVNGTLQAPFYKKSQVRENYNQLTLKFKTFDLVFRAYDAGVAYRFVSGSKAPFKVLSETAQFAFPEDWNMFVPYVKDKKPTLEEQF